MRDRGGEQAMIRDTMSIQQASGAGARTTLARGVGVLLGLLAGALLAGCGVGIGSSYVGQWRERSEVQYEVCIEDEAGQCQTRRAITSHLPARKFWGMKVSYPVLGLASVSRDGESRTLAQLDLSAEYLQGKGRLAGGVRGGLVTHVASDIVFAFPVMAMGHVGISERLGLYGGAGYVPYAELLREEMDGITSNLGWRALGGVQIVMNRTHTELRILLNLEADHMVVEFGDFSQESTGLSFQFEVAF